MTSLPKVKCLYCGEMLERNSYECMKVTVRRYAHVKCVKELPPEEIKRQQDYENLKDYINELFGKSADWAMITKQIRQYTGDGLTYSGMLKSLKYAYEVKKEDKEKANGQLWVIPRVYKQAYEYYYDLWLKQEQNRDAEKAVIREVEIRICPPRARHRIKLFDLGED